MTTYQPSVPTRKPDEVASQGQSSGEQTPTAGSLRLGHSGTSKHQACVPLHNVLSLKKAEHEHASELYVLHSEDFIKVLSATYQATRDTEESQSLPASAISRHFEQESKQLLESGAARLKTVWRVKTDDPRSNQPWSFVDVRGKCGLFEGHYRDDKLSSGSNRCSRAALCIKPGATSTPSMSFALAADPGSAEQGKFRSKLESSLRDLTGDSNLSVELKDIPCSEFERVDTPYSTIELTGSIANDGSWDPQDKQQAIRVRAILPGGVESTDDIALHLPCI